MIFQTAIAEELIFTNPVSLSENIKTRQKEIVPLTINEAQLLLNSVKDMKVHTGIPWYPIILLCLECGFRRGEVLGLHWSDIDTVNNTITIHRSIASDTSIQTPKTQKAQRTIAGNNVTKDVYTHKIIPQLIAAVDALPHGENMTIYPDENGSQLEATDTK